MMVDDPKTLSGQDARQGKTLGVMRYVLYASLTLAVIAGVIVYASYAGG